MATLRIIIEPDVTGDGNPDVKITPIALPVSDTVADIIRSAIAAGDAFDAEPGNGQIDVQTDVHLPKMRLWFVTIGGRDYPLNVTVTCE